jgi:hypothetical protein
MGVQLAPAIVSVASTIRDTIGTLHYFQHPCGNSVLSDRSGHSRTCCWPDSVAMTRTRHQQTSPFEKATLSQRGSSKPAGTRISSRESILTVYSLYDNILS